MTFADYDGTRPPEHLPVSYWTEELGGSPARRHRPGHVARARTGSTATSVATGSRTSPSRSGIGEYHADSFTAVFADFTGDGLPDIYQANDHRPDRFFGTWAAARFRDRSTKPA